MRDRSHITWVGTDATGIHVSPAQCYIDPVRPCTTAIITHGHADHARAGHKHVIATPETLAIMAVRYGEQFAQTKTALCYGSSMMLGPVKVTLHPAGHVLGSAQIILDFQGQRVIAAGDYKRKPDPTCQPFLPVPCDVFITEATFGLPVFRHPDPMTELKRLLAKKYLFPERTIVIGAYALGKAQRIIALLREAGYNAPIYIHGALQKLCNLYEEYGIALGPLLPATAGKAGAPQQELKGQIVIAPPSAIGAKWAQRLYDPLIVFASGWMQVRQRAKQRGVEFPLILSDHADWDDLLMTIEQINPGEVWVTHGREDALIRACQMRGFQARALSVVGYEEGEA